jgi:transcriptional antiterminator NusG
MIEESINPEQEEQEEQEQQEVEQEQEAEQAPKEITPIPDMEHDGVAPAQDTKWYVLRVVSGKERKVKEYLDIEVRRSDWGSMIAQIFLPVEKVYKVLAGKKVMREKNFYPGYIMIEAIDGKMSDDVIQAIRNVSGVIHFLGKDKPIALRKAEVNKMLGKVDEMSDNGLTMSEPFIVGETIKIIDGPFNDFNGVIEEVIEDKKKLKVTVKIFGRATPVELNFMQVEKIS